MDTILARTFLAIAETGSFVSAAARLNVTQSTVSARVRALETELGQKLFERGRAGAAVTDAGRRFALYASAAVRLAEQMLHELSLPEGIHGAVTVGGQVSLWDRLLPPWLAWMRVNAPEIAVRVDVGSSDQLASAVTDGSLSLAVSYVPLSRSGFVSEVLFIDELVMVAAFPMSVDSVGPASKDYVFVDWGPDFAALHAEAFAECPPPRIVIRIGALGLQHILSNSGSGYFPMRIVEPLIRQGRVVQVEGAPVFERPAYLVRSTDRDDTAVVQAMAGLREIARSL